MNDERKRILRMLAEGTISVDECEELLESLQQEQAEVEKETHKANASTVLRPQLRRHKIHWLARVALIVLLLFCGLLLARVLHVRVWDPIIAVLPIVLLPPIFWLWMLIDCLKRDRADFATSITEKHDKLVWLLLIIFVPVIGAIAYYFVVGRYTRQSLPEGSRS